MATKMETKTPPKVIYTYMYKVTIETEGREIFIAGYHKSYKNSLSEISFLKRYRTKRKDCNYYKALATDLSMVTSWMCKKHVGCYLEIHRELLFD